ncbi:MAG: hypothetical protein V4671_06170 [Armatimonadota bacterium]
MQRWQIISASLVVLVAASGSIAAGQEAAKTKTVIPVIPVIPVSPGVAMDKPLHTLHTFYARLAVLTRHDNFKAVADLLDDNTTSDWTSIDAKGTSHSREQVIQALRSVGVSASHPTSKIVTYVTSGHIVEKIRLKGDTAYADFYSFKTRKEVDTEGKYGAPGKTHRVKRVEPRRDVWVKQAGVWKLQQSRRLPTRVEVDGKPWKGR